MSDEIIPTKENKTFIQSLANGGLIGKRTIVAFVFSVIGFVVLSIMLKDNTEFTKMVLDQYKDINILFFGVRAGIKVLDRVKGIPSSDD